MVIVGELPTPRLGPAGEPDTEKIMAMVPRHNAYKDATQRVERRHPWGRGGPVDFHGWDGGTVGTGEPYNNYNGVIEDHIPQRAEE